MTTYIITYDLSKPGQDYSDLIAAIKKYQDWLHPQKSVWFVKSETKATAIRDNLKRYLDSNDKLFVSDGSSWATFGHSKTANDWFRLNISGA